MDKQVIYKPADLVRGPFDSVPMHTLRSIEAKFNVTWRASVAVVEFSAGIAWVVEDIDEHSARAIAGDLDINFLVW
nr:hypothetical protein [Brevundimonas sp.]